MRSIELWCAIAHLRISRFPVWSFGPSRNDEASFPRHHLLDLAQLLLAEEHLLADEEGRRAERAALDGRLRILDQLGLHVRLLRACETLCPVEPARSEHCCGD